MQCVYLQYFFESNSILPQTQCGGGDRDISSNRFSSTQRHCTLCRIQVTDGLDAVFVQRSHALKAPNPTDCREHLRIRFYHPVLVDLNNRIVAGHGAVARRPSSLAWSRIPTIRLESMSEEQIRAYVIADNKLAENAGWDRYILAIELVFVFRKGKGPHRNNLQLGQFGRNRTNVWQYPGVQTLSKQGGEEDLLAP